MLTGDRDNYRRTISICILKGRTTTEEQFERFLNSISNAAKSGYNNLSTLFELFFMVDTDESYKMCEELKLPSCGFNKYILRRNSDAGDLRNEFMSTLVHLYSVYGDRNDYLDHQLNDYFGFMDGDDQVNENYFSAIARAADNEGNDLLILNPVSVYSDNGLTDQYPLKWYRNCLTAKEEGRSLIDLALDDTIGGQAWGKFYRACLLYESGAKFGKGLYEDVPFWYSICSRVTWNQVALVPDAIYYWRRDNNLSLTRITPDWAAFCNAFDNLEKACDIAVNKFRVFPSDVRVWKRYTTGILNLLRNAQKVEPELKDKYITKILERINVSYFKPTQLEVIEPNYMEKVKADCPEYSLCLAKDTGWKLRGLT